MDNKKVENKKQMSNKKKFWIGMSSLAAIGIITATIAYFQASHEFKNEFVASSYNVTIQQIFDKEAASRMFPGQTVEADVSVKNNATSPILARVKYVPGIVEDGNIKWSENETVSLDNLGDAWTASYSETFSRVSENPDTNNKDDGYYYYTGVLGEGEEAHHLKSLTLKSTIYNKDGKTEYYNGEDWIQEETKKGERKTVGTGDALVYFKAVVETIQATNKDGTELIMGDTPSAKDIQGAWTTLTTPSTP